MSIFQNSILSKAREFGGSIAFLDRSSGSSVSFDRLEEFLLERLPGGAFDVTRPIATWGATDFVHVSFLMAMLAKDALVAPLSLRLPADVAMQRAVNIGASAFWKNGELVHLDSPIAPLSLQRGGTLLSTSGSSGQPRMVCHGLDSHFANALGAASQIRLEPGCGWLQSLPLNHVSGISIPFRCLLSGAAVVFPDPACSLREQICDPAVTHLSLVGVQLRRLLAEGAPLSRLQAVLLGGGPVDEGLVAEALRANVPLHITYGMTETASQISTTSRLYDLPNPIHAGHPLPSREVRISSTGEIQIRGPVLPHAIFVDGKPLPVVDQEGWFSTGDAGFFDSSGHLVVTGRLNRMFISGGENIYPEMIEGLLAGMCGVRRVVVVGVPHPEFGTRPVAFVAGDVDHQSMRDFLRSRVEGFYIPDEFLPWPSEVSVEEPKLDFASFTRLACERALC